MVECEYCNKKYSTNSSLKTHQKKTKKCLQLQQKIIDYNIRLNIEFEKLPKFTKENVKASLLTYLTINSIKGGKEQYINDVIKGIINFALITDRETGDLIIKDEDGNMCKSTADKVVRDSFMFIKDEQLKLLEEIIKEMNSDNN